MKKCRQPDSNRYGRLFTSTRFSASRAYQLHHVGRAESRGLEPRTVLTATVFKTASHADVRLSKNYYSDLLAFDTLTSTGTRIPFNIGTTMNSPTQCQNGTL